ncbi:hypothetical protein L7F22_064562 [Adiantum nelumboides]|nr:hypothetical protein [Adiantum nelumboides]
MALVYCSLMLIFLVSHNLLFSYLISDFNFHLYAHYYFELIKGLIMFRPHPSECSGSDLDGDLYFVSWDENLIPPSIHPPQDYQPPPEKKLDRPVTTQVHEPLNTSF